MARDIAGSGATGNRIEWSGVSDLATGDWTVAQWVYVRSAVNVGRFWAGSNGTDATSRQTLRCNGASDTSPFVTQGFSTTAASCISGTALTTSIWSLLVGMFDSGGAMGTANRPHVFQGDVATAMFQPTETLVTGVGTRNTGTTLYRVGNLAGSSPTTALNGIVGLTLVYNRLLSLAEAEGIRLGLIPPDAIFWAPLNDSTLAQNVDLVSGVNGTITGAAVAVAEDPPVAYFQPFSPAVVQPAGSAYPQAVLADTPFGYWRLGEASGTSATDSSGNANTGTYVNTPTLGVAGGISGSPDTAVTFASGSSQRVDLPYLSTAGADLTYECWIKTSTTGANRCLVSEGNSGNGNNRIELNITSNNTACFQMTNSAGTLYRNFNAGPNICDGNWHHVVGVLSGTSLLTYVDGVSIHTAITISGTFTTNRNRLADLSTNADNYLTGTLDEAAIYKSALSAARILVHYNTGINAQSVSPSAIASGETWGTAVITTGSVTVSPSGIGSAEAWGGATVTNAGPTQTISPTGIPSGETWGTATVSPGDVTISPAAIDSAEAWGTALISRPTLFSPPADAVVSPVYVVPDSYAPVPAISQRLFRHYKPRYAGRNIFKLANGTYTETAPYPNIDASTQPGQAGDTTVLKTYLGGHIYEVSADEAAELVAAGYGPYVA